MILKKISSDKYKKIYDRLFTLRYDPIGNSPRCSDYNSRGPIFFMTRFEFESLLKIVKILSICENGLFLQVSLNKTKSKTGNNWMEINYQVSLL